MKPVIIYALPRSRSTAALHSCKREVKLHEPFGLNRLYKDNNSGHAWNFRAKLNNNLVNSGQWSNLVTKMNSSNTVTKILSTDLYGFLPARQWFINSSENQTHDVFVIERENREETILSYIMANYFGWHKTSEVEPYEFTVNDDMLQILHNTIDWYLRFYPKRGRIITYDSLPGSHFDKSLNHTEDQKSSSKLKYFKNLEEYRGHIKYILDYYQYEWDSKIKNLDQS
jgi:hypothetical protein